MSDNLRVFQYSEFKTPEKKKKESNAFFLYRNSIKEKAPKNIKMTELSKIASDSWKNLPEEEKTKWKRLYEINRDQDLPNDREQEKVEADKTKKAVKNIQGKVEKATLGDLGALAEIKEKLKQEIDKGEFLEWGEFNGNYYGTKMDSVREIIRAGRLCVLDSSPQVSQFFYLFLTQEN